MRKNIGHPKKKWVISQLKSAQRAILFVIIGFLAAIQLPAQAAFEPADIFLSFNGEELVPLSNLQVIEVSDPVNFILGSGDGWEVPQYVTPAIIAGVDTGGEYILALWVPLELGHGFTLDHEYYCPDPMTVCLIILGDNGEVVIKGPVVIAAIWDLAYNPDADVIYAISLGYNAAENRLYWASW